jgi:glycosyltransferase involved in cell wall biosynthesis
MSLKDGPLPKTFIGQRVCKDAPSQLWFQIAVLKDRPKMVFEVDDDLWNIDPSNAGAFTWFVNGRDKDGTIHNVGANLRRNIAAADVVTCTTEPLAELLRQYNPNVHIIPNYIPRWVTEWERPKRDKLAIGWSGSSTHSMDWDYSGSHIKRFLKRNPHVDFSLIGAPKGSDIGLPDDRVDAKSWIPSVDGLWKALDMDIMVIPLKPHVFNQSKSPLKALEAAALGIPVVADLSGPYPGFVKHGETGFLVRYEHEWNRYLRDLVNDEAMREEMGRNARKQAQQWILEDHLDEYTKVYCD